MLNMAVIIVIVISLACGAYALMLLSRLRKVYSVDFLNSFYYYEILHFGFGIYGILGGTAIRQILQKFDLLNVQVELVALAIPFFGVPFIIAAWYLLIKTCNEITGKSIPQYVSVIYFVLTTLFFLVYGYILRSDSDQRQFDPGTMSQGVRIVFYSVELAVKIYLALVLIINALKARHREERMFMARFALMLVGFALISSAGLHFAYIHTIVSLYFLLVWFGSDIAIILLIRSYLQVNEPDFADQTDALENLYQKYGISKREKEIITEICKGKTNSEIADDLFISLQTVKDHTYNIFRKVRVRNRVELARIFSQNID